jgi:hypothetical protein
MVTHPSIVLGVERYISFAFRKGAFSPQIFQFENFFNLEPGQTFYQDLVGFNSYYNDARVRFPTASWIGDKIPPLYRIYDEIDEKFENAHILFIVRNIYDVAASFQKRALNVEDKTWDATRDYKRAVTDWHESLLTTSKFLSKNDRKTGLTILSYEDIFTERGNISAIFNLLGLDVPAAVTREYNALLHRSSQLESGRGDVLRSADRNFISLNASFGLYREIYKSRLTLNPPSE